MIISDNIESSINFIIIQLKEKEKPFKIFFDSDNFIINELIVCIESGIICIVLDLEKIYRTFNDFLKQNYSKYGEEIYCRVFFEKGSTKIEVNPNFKFILIAKIEEVNSMDESYLNYFEKHEHEYSLETCQNYESVKKISNNITEWMEKFFKNNFIFANINYLLISLIQTQINLEKLNKNNLDKKNISQIIKICKDELIWLANFENIFNNFENKEELLKIYTKDQFHFSLKDFLEYSIRSYNDVLNSNSKHYWIDNIGFKSIIYTTSS